MKIQGLPTALPAVLPLLLAPGHADAHIIAARLGDFYTGALHPLTDPQDVVPWLALALFAGSLGARHARWLVPLVPLGLLAGFVLESRTGLGRIGTLGAAALMVGVGLLLAAGVRASGRLLLLVTALVTVTSGASNAAGMAADSSAPLFVAGLASAGYVAFTLALALTVAFRWPVRPDAVADRGWRAIALRVCGSWIAAIGLMVGGFALKTAAG